MSYDKRLLVLNDTSVTGHYGCIAVMRSLRQGLMTIDRSSLGYIPLGTSLESLKNLMNSTDFDAVLINGEGTIHNSASNSRASTLIEAGAYAKYALGKKCFLINTTLFNIADNHLDLLRGFTYISCRDTASAGYLRQMGINSHFAPDLSLKAFNVEIAKKSTYPRQAIIVVDSVLRDVSTDLLSFSRLHGYEYKEFKHWHGDQLSPLNLALWVRKYASWRRNKELRQSYYQHELKSWGGRICPPWTRRARMIISGRFHAMLMSACLNIPFIAIKSNTPKVEAVLNDLLGSNKRLFTSVESILPGSIAKYSRFTPDESIHISQYVKSALKKQDLMFSQISLLLN